MERKLGVEPSSGVVGNDTSHHVHPRVWLVWLDLHQLPSAYRAGAHLYVLHTINWSGRQDLHLRPPSSKLGRLLLTYALNVVWTARIERAWLVRRRHVVSQ